MSIELISLLLFGSIFLLFAIGLPISFTLGATSVIFLLIFLGTSHLLMVATSLYGAMTRQTLMAIPLFIFMGNVLASSGIAREFFTAMYNWSGPIRGGLAMGTEVLCGVFAAMCGTTEGATVTMGVTALPAMLDHGYDKNLAIGSLASGALLGILIPPSILAILYASISGTSIGKLYFAILVPGLVLLTLYILYNGIRCYMQPELAPALPKEERPSWQEKFISLKGIALPALIVFAVLGGIYSGATTPTEAAGVGALGVVIAALIHRKLSWTKLKEALLMTVRLTGMVAWLIMCVTLFAHVYGCLGIQQLVQNIVAALPISGFGIIILMQLSIFLLGMVIDDVSIILICTPIYLPIVTSLGFDPLWFAVLFMVNMQCAWMTPPYGFNLFIVKAVVPEWITMVDIYRAVIPFIGLQIACLLLVMFIPGIATWLPSMIIAR